MKKKIETTQRKQGDFFEITQPISILKSDRHTMEFPIFALKEGLKDQLVFEQGGNRIQVFPGFHGRATQDDKDLLVYCASQLVKAANEGKKIERTVRITAAEYLKATGRKTSGRDYMRFATSLERLAGTRLQTNIKTNGQREIHGFGLIEEYKIVVKDNKERMVAIDITLSQWSYRAILGMEVLSLNPAYYSLTALQKRVYEMARKHCGNQNFWSCNTKALHEKSGATQPVRSFRYTLKKMCAEQPLPDYTMTYQQDSDSILFTKK